MVSYIRTITELRSFTRSGSNARSALRLKDLVSDDLYDLRQATLSQTPQKSRLEYDQDTRTISYHPVDYGPSKNL